MGSTAVSQEVQEAISLTVCSYPQIAAIVLFTQQALGCTHHIKSAYYWLFFSVSSEDPVTQQFSFLVCFLLVFPYSITRKTIVYFLKFGLQSTVDVVISEPRWVCVASQMS